MEGKCATCGRATKKDLVGNYYANCWDCSQKAKATADAPQQDAREAKDRRITRLSCMSTAAAALQAAVASQPMGKTPITPQQAFELVVEGAKKFEEAME